MSWPRLFFWFIYAAAFGMVEAAVVIYIRKNLGMAPGIDYPAGWAAKQLPFNSASITGELRAHRFLPVELWREVATLLLLLGAACGAGRTAWERLGLFGFTFAVWDLTYYFWLFVWSGFPRSVFDTDIYFLLPVALYGPVWLPLIGMTIIALISLRLLRVKKPPRAYKMHGI
jgi:hypothetical protein